MGELIISPIVQTTTVAASAGMVRAKAVSAKPRPDRKYPSAITGCGRNRKEKLAIISSKKTIRSPLSEISKPKARVGSPTDFTCSAKVDPI